MIVRAFVEAGAWALASIAVLLFFFLRRLCDVMLTLVPLALAGLVTMELMALLGMSFNFANIIALPLLLGVGVAFKIYYIIAWREGTTHLLQTPLTRAVFYSALTTATAFGSLWFSSHPGTSSMGKLLALSLACTLAAAVLFQPILMGKPRAPADRRPLTRKKRRRRCLSAACPSPPHCLCCRPARWPSQVLRRSRPPVAPTSGVSATGFKRTQGRTRFSSACRSTAPG